MHTAVRRAVSRRWPLVLRSSLERKFRPRYLDALRAKSTGAQPQTPRYDLSGLHIRPIWPSQSRAYGTSAISTVLAPPAVFAGLLLGLWIYKCAMMVLFQDKIIYMPYVPPFAQSEKMEDYRADCKPVEWDQRYITSLDGTRIAVCVGAIPPPRPSPALQVSHKSPMKRVVICYFQGNGASLPPRLPLLSRVMKMVHERSAPPFTVEYSLVALSYRGYWKSSGRATQSGIELDAQALLDWVATTYASSSDSDLQIVLWGQSIGAGVASVAAAARATSVSAAPLARLKIAALVLETPFSSVRSMLAALYPQTWLPYRYLWPFLWNSWDTATALHRIAAHGSSPRVLLLPASKDEVVPSHEADKLEHICRRLGVRYERHDVIGALHSEATARAVGQAAVARFIVDVVELSGQ